jgi:chemotaxis family two-component system response regulator Rcp1
MHENIGYRWRVSKSAAVVSKAVHLLLVEDTPGDVLLMRDAFRGSGIRLHVATDGADAIAFLKRAAPHSFAPWPHLILLDLNLPKIHGHEVLAYIKSNDSLTTIPTVILTSSDDIEDIEKSYRLHANCYLKKPVTFHEFEQLVKSIKDFWFNKATLPPRASRA